MSDMNVNAAVIYKRLGRHEWFPPEDSPLPGGFGWVFRKRDEPLAMIVSSGPSADSLMGRSNDHSLWLHASVSRLNEIPSYDDLQIMYRAVWGEHGWAYQVFAPLEAHVNIHANALHLWGRLDGKQELPNFGALGTI